MKEEREVEGENQNDAETYLSMSLRSSASGSVRPTEEGFQPAARSVRPTGGEIYEIPNGSSKLIHEVQPSGVQCRENVKFPPQLAGV